MLSSDFIILLLLEVSVKSGEGQLFISCGLANLYVVRRHLLAAA